MHERSLWRITAWGNGSVGQERLVPGGRDGSPIEVRGNNRMLVAIRISAVAVVASLLGVAVYAVGLSDKSRPDVHYLGWCDVAGGLEGMVGDSDRDVQDNFATIVLAATEAIDAMTGIGEQSDGIDQEDEEFYIVYRAADQSRAPDESDMDDPFFSDYLPKEAALRERACRLLLAHKATMHQIIARLLLDGTVSGQRLVELASSATVNPGPHGVTPVVAGLSPKLPPSH